MTLWYLQRPRLYPRLASEIRRQLGHERSPLDDTSREAASWCDARAIGTAEALQKFDAPLNDEARFSVRFASELEDAEQIVRNCPVEMGGPGDLDLLYSLAERVQARKIIETGVAYGWSSLAILCSLATRDGARLISSDMPYPGRNNDRHVGCVVPKRLLEHWQLLRSADRQSLPKAIRLLGTIDMCHYDSDKSRAGRLWAYPLLWNTLRPGGVFVSDDVSDNLAFRDFASTTSVEPLIVRHQDKFVGILRKPGNL